MRIIQMENGAELEISDKTYKAIEPYYPYRDTKRNGKFKVRGTNYETKNIKLISETVDDSFMSRIKEGTDYVNRSAPQDYKAVNKERWRTEQNRKLDTYATNTPHTKLMVEKARELIGRFYPIRSGAGMAYIKACMNEIKLKKRANNLF